MKSNYKKNIKVSQNKKASFDEITELVNSIRTMPSNSTIAILANNIKNARDWCLDAIMTLAKKSGERAKYLQSEPVIRLSYNRSIVFGNYRKIDSLIGLRVYNAIIIDPENDEFEKIKYHLAPLMIELGLTNEN